MSLAEWLGIGKTIKDGADGMGSLVETTILNIKGELSPADKAEIEKLKIIAAQQFEQTALKSTEQFHNFMLKYEGAANEVHPFIQITRSLVRPIVTYFFVFVLGLAFSIDFYKLLFMKSNEFFLINNLPEEFWWVMGLILGFWFAGRAGENVINQIKK